MTLTPAEIIALAKHHTMFEWMAQNAVDPLLVTRAKGVHFWTADGKRFLDFNSQQMCVNVGHGNERIIKAIQDQVATLASSAVTVFLFRRTATSRASAPFAIATASS